MSKFLQNRKIELLRNDFIVEFARRNYFNKIRVQHFTNAKLISFNTLQLLFVKSSYFVHLDTKRQLFIDFDVNKTFEFDVMFSYMKQIYLNENTFESNKFSFRHVIKSLLFLNRLIIDAKSKY